MEKILRCSSYRKCGFYLLQMMFLALFVGCTKVQLIASYDEETDVAVTQLQRKFETFFVNLEDQLGTQNAGYENHKQFYKSIRVDISAIKLRVAAHPKNEITLDMVDLLESNVDILVELHKEGINSIDVISIVRDDFNVALTNILKLELAKKRGKEEVE